MWQRNLRHTDNLKGDKDYDHETVSIADAGLSNANLICSDLASTVWDGDGVLHAVTLDIDHEVTVIPSSTPGHYHLYIDHGLTWPQYVKLMNVMADIGLLEQGYVDASLNRGFSSLRLPWLHKNDDM